MVDSSLLDRFDDSTFDRQRRERQLRQQEVGNNFGIESLIGESLRKVLQRESDDLLAANLLNAPMSRNLEQDPLAPRPSASDRLRGVFSPADMEQFLI